MRASGRNVPSPLLRCSGRRLFLQPDRLEFAPFAILLVISRRRDGRFRRVARGSNLNGRRPSIENSFPIPYHSVRPDDLNEQQWQAYQ